MKSMEGFMLYNADLDAVRGLSDADFRKLILALSSVSKGEEMHPPAGEAGMAFHFMAFKVEQAYKKYLKRCEVNRENATAKEANGSESQRMAANGSESPITSNNKQVTSNDKDIGVGEKHKRFSPPTPDEVNKYGREHGYTVDGQRFCDFYASKGWKVGNTPMKDWQAAVRTWARKDAPEAAPKPKSKFDGLNLSTVL